MSVSANIPALGNKITKDVPDQNALNQRMMRCDFSDVVDLPVGTKALVESAEGWEVRQYNGTGWVLLEKWNIDAQKVDGYSASTGTTANTIPVRDASGKLPGDITGNAASATEAAALSATNPIELGGTGATTIEQARANLGVAPKSHASSTTDYGAGSSTQYGHVKTHDTPDATKTAATGHAFSPAGAAMLEGQIGDLASVVSGNAASQAAKDAAQDAAIAGKLSTSGGTMSRSLYMDEWANINFSETASIYGTDTGSFTVHGGSVWNKCAKTSWFGKDNPNDAGDWVSYGYDPTDGTMTELRIDASERTVKFNSRPILTSAGGTMGGKLTFSSQRVIDSTNAGGLFIIAESEKDSNFTGALACFPVNHSDKTRNGGFQCVASDGTNRKSLIGHYEHGLKWDVNPVLTLVASWRDEHNWYRKYSDGWIEQGGKIDGGKNFGYFPVVLHTPFTTNKYTALVAAHGGNWDYGYYLYDHSTTGFEIAGRQGGYYYWYACGY